MKKFIYVENYNLIEAAEASIKGSSIDDLNELLKGVHDEYSRRFRRNPELFFKNFHKNVMIALMVVFKFYKNLDFGESYSFWNYITDKKDLRRAASYLERASDMKPEEIRMVSFNLRHPSNRRVYI